MCTLTRESYVFDPCPNYPLLVTVKRYWVPGFDDDSEGALTLILTHGVGFHKEIWEPTVEYLYDLFAKRPSLRRILDIWSIDAPNYGDAAVLNEEVLPREASEHCSSSLSHYRAFYSLVADAGHSSRLAGVRARCACVINRTWYRSRC